MSRLGTGRFSTALRRFLQITTGGNPGEEISPDLVATLEDFLNPEMAYLANVRLCMGRGVKAAVVAERSGISLANISNSGVLMHIHFIGAISAAASDTVTLGQGAFTPVGVQQSRTRDLRWETGGTACRLSTGAITGLTGFGEFELTGNLAGATFFAWRHPLLLPPGTDWQFQNGADNVALTGWAIWSERQMLPTEVS